MSYPPGPYVLLNAVNMLLYRPSLSASSLVQEINNLPKYNPPDSQAEELLTKVCEHIHCCRYAGNESISYHKDINYMEDIEGLAEWWEKNRPEGKERKKKLEKIKKILDVPIHTPDIAERILNALES